MLKASVPHQTFNFIRLLNKKVMTGHLARTTALTMAGVLALASSAYAVGPNELPTGGTVVGGTAGINYNGNNMTVTQTGGIRTVIDWNTFNIGQNASAHFQQLSNNSITINRVTGPGNDPSQILGNLRSTVNGQVGGRVMILDPNGVLFGQNATIDVGGLVASTGQLNDVAGFIAGGPNTPVVLENTDARGNRIVENRGRINVADGGMLALIAPTVRNSGVINARRGYVALAAGQHATLDFYGDNLINISLSGELERALVENTRPNGPFGRGGQIYADGGVVTMTAGAARSVVDSVVNMHGVVRANSFSNQNGRIVLTSAGQVNVSGRLESRNATPSTTAPAISITGHDVNITADSHSFLSGVADGIFADALGPNGNGGSVYIWGTNRVTFAGRIDVSGGSNSGNGGNAEISGNGDIAYRGIVDASAPNGTRGTLTIDPSIVRIGNSMFDPVVNAQYLAQTLGLTNVHIIAGDRIVLVDQANLSHWGFGGLSVTQGNLTLDAPTVDLLHDLIMGAGNLSVNATTVNLGGRLYRNTFPIYTSLFNQLMSQTHLSGNASVVNVLGNMASIQQGIHLAGSGATVYVAAANYAENINIYKSVTLQGVTGAGGNQPLLFGTTPGGAVIMVSANNVTVDGFDIVAQTVPWFLPSLYAINAENVSGLTVRNTHMTGPFAAGLRLVNVDGAQIVNNAVENSLFGVLASGGSNLNLRGNTILNTVTGMHIADASNVRMVANTIVNSLLNGINILRSNNVDIARNRIFASGMDGIHAQDVNNLDVSKNVIMASGDDGIDIDGGKDISLNLNDIFGSRDNGVEISNARGLKISDNTVMFSGADGMSIHNVRGLTLANNNIFFAGGNGINVEDSRDIDAFLNNIGYVAGHGFAASNVSGLDIYNNRITHTGKDGIHLSEVSRFSIAGNDIAHAGRDGIFIEGSKRGKIAGNSVIFSQRDGIHIAKSSAVNLNDNLVAYSGDDGIDAENVSDLTLNGNSVFFSKDNGIELSQAQRVVVTNNDVIISGGDGINVTDSTDLKIRGNFVMGSVRNGVYLSRVDRATVDGNNIARSGQNGIYAVSGSDMRIDRNTINDSQLDGIRLEQSRRTQITQNNVTRSGDAGIRVVGDRGDRLRTGSLWNDNILIAGNVIEKARDGIFVNDSMYVEIADNGVYNVINNAIAANSTAGLIIRNNFLRGYGQSGINVSRSKAVTISYNLIEGQGRGAAGITLGQSRDPLSGNGGVTIDNNVITGNSIGLDARALNNSTVNVFGNSFINNQFGLWASSGQFNLDQPGFGNLFRGGQIAMIFDGPAARNRATGYTGLSLVGDTLGETVFEGQTQYYVDLRNGAFFAPGTPTIIDGTLSTYDGVFGGLMSLAELDVIRGKINDFVDDGTLGLIFAGGTDLDDNQILRRILSNRYAAGRGGVVVTGLPATSTANIGANRPFFTASDLASIAPASGNSPGTLANIEPAAGGEDSSPAPLTRTAPRNIVNASCWAQLGGGGAMSFDMSDNPADVLKDQASCEI